MDKPTHNIRTASWRNIIENCQARPEGQTAKSWLQENGISEKQYYYWLRKLRRQEYSNLQSADKLPTVPIVSQPATVDVAEIPAEDIFPQVVPAAAVTIKAKDFSLEISSVVSDCTMIELVKAVSHAI